MSKRLYYIPKLMLIASVMTSFGGGDLYCKVTPIMDLNPTGSSSPHPKDWKYNDELSRAIRKYDADNEKWRSVKQAILRCQGRVLKNYEAKVAVVLDENQDDMTGDFRKLKALEHGKDQAFITCVNAFQSLSVSDRKTLREEEVEESRWKNNDDVSKDIRKYDRVRNRWIDEEQAILRCERQAEANFESKIRGYDSQRDFQAIEDLKALEKRTFIACQRAFER